MRRELRLAVLGSALALAGTPARAAGDPCANPAACCVDPSVCVITDKQALASVTVDAMLPAGVDTLKLGTWVSGGDPAFTGVAPAGFLDGDLCGLSNKLVTIDPAAALASADHQWLAGFDTPIVVDFGAPVNTVFVLPAVDHPPFPEEGIEHTVWGSASPDVAGFPSGWQRATLNHIWQQGWEQPPQCEPGDNSDDFVGQYTFPGPGFRYVAVYANFSVTIFDDPGHTSWTPDMDNAADVPGWQSDDAEIDAVAAPTCAGGAVTVDAGPDVSAKLGDTVCLTGQVLSGSGVTELSWDLDGDGEVDATGAEACFTCTSFGARQATFFAIGDGGCAGSDVAAVTCGCPGAPAEGCRAAAESGKGSLSLGATRGSLSWSLRKGAATTKADLGDPTRDTEYGLCVYDEAGGAPSLALQAAVPPGAGWRGSKKGFAFRAPRQSAPPGGVTSLALQAGDAGRSRVALKGKGMALPALPLAQGNEVVVQLLQSQGACFESRFAAPATRNDAKKFKDRD